MGMNDVIVFESRTTLRAFRNSFRVFVFSKLVVGETQQLRVSTGEISH